MPISEVSHARNIASLEQMISMIAAFGAIFDPSNGDISVSKLTNKLNASNTANDDVQSNFAAKTMEINVRETKYKLLGPLGTKTINFYASTGTEQNNVEDAKTINRKLQGRRKTPAVKDDPATPADESKKSISASQQSYTQKVEHFDGMIEIYSDDPLYAPNEAAITITSLKAFSAELKTANTNVINALTDYANSRITRNTVMYHPKTGLYNLSVLVKKYVLSLFGATSPEYKMIRKLKFTDETL